MEQDRFIQRNKKYFQTLRLSEAVIGKCKKGVAEKIATCLFAIIKVDIK